MKSLFISVFSVLLPTLAYCQSNTTKALTNSQHAQKADTTELMNSTVSTDQYLDYLMKLSIPDRRQTDRKLADKRYRNETIRIDIDSLEKAENFTHRTYTYTYDSLHRLVRYAYSGCLACLDRPYDYAIIYNPNWQPGISGKTDSGTGLYHVVDKLDELRKAVIGKGIK